MFENETPFVSQIGYVTRDLDYTIDRLKRILDYAPIERRDAAELEIERQSPANEQPLRGISRHGVESAGLAGRSPDDDGHYVYAIAN